MVSKKLVFYLELKRRAQRRTTHRVWKGDHMDKREREWGISGNFRGLAYYYRIKLPAMKTSEKAWGARGKISVHPLGRVNGGGSWVRCGSLSQTEK